VPPRRAAARERHIGSVAGRLEYEQKKRTE